MEICAGELPLHPRDPSFPLVIPLLLISVHLRNCELGEVDPGACEEVCVGLWSVVVGV